MSGSCRLLRPIAALFASMVAFAAPPASAQPYPSQPIKVIVPTAPGGVADIVARAFAHKLGEGGKTIVVENRTGAAGTIAADFVAKSPPDGYTVYVGFHGTQSILPHLMKLPYDAAKDFSPVILVARSPNILVVHPSVPAQSLRQLIDYAKANPGRLTYASQGNGSSGHIVAEQFKQVAGTDIAHVPYRGAAPAVQDLVAGHVTMMFDILTLAVPQVKPARCARSRSPRRSGSRRCPMCRPWRKPVCRNWKAARGSACWSRLERPARSSIGSTARPGRRSKRPTCASAWPRKISRFRSARPRISPLTSRPKPSDGAT